VFKVQTVVYNVPFTHHAVKPCVRELWYPAGLCVCCIHPRRAEG